MAYLIELTTKKRRRRRGDGFGAALFGVSGRLLDYIAGQA
jgi:hypothetical protein